MATKSISNPKIQETSTLQIFDCLWNKSNKENLDIHLYDYNNYKQQVENDKIKFEKGEINSADLIQSESALDASLVKLRILQEENHNCGTNKKSKINIMVEINKRFGMPIFIPLISLICSFLLSSHKSQKSFFSKYIPFVIGFVILALAEITVRYSGVSLRNTLIYYFFPILMSPIFYFVLIKKFKYENI